MRLKPCLVIALLFVFSVSFVKGWTAQTGDVVINEVAWAGTGASANDEWIELFNPTSQSIDLTGWTLTAIDGTPSITLSGTITANGFLLLERSDDSTVSDIIADLIYTGALSNSGETLQLNDDQGNLIDSANGNGGAWPAGDNASKATMERIDPRSSDADTNWANHTSTLQNGSDANNDLLNATARSRNSVTNTPPTCNNINTNTQIDVSVTINLIPLCSDSDGDTLTFNLATTPTLGSVSCNGTGNSQCSYTPNPGVSGSDNFLFKAQDPFGDSATAQASIDIQAVPPPSVTFFASHDGDDGNDGLTPATALRTIQNAIDRSANGGRVVVLGGTFQETLSLNKPLTLEAAEATILSGSGVTISADGVTLKGFSIEGASTGVLITSSADHVILHQNALVGNGIGLDNQSAHTVEAGDNWWGCNAGPNQNGCDGVLGNANTSPWLIVQLDAKLDTPLGYTATLTIDFGKNSQGSPVSHPLSRPISLQVEAGGVLQTNAVVQNLISAPWLPWLGLLTFVVGSAILWYQRSHLQRAVLIGLMVAAVYLGGCGAPQPLGVHAAVFILSQQGMQIQLLAFQAGEITVSAKVDGQSLTRNVLFLLSELLEIRNNYQHRHRQSLAQQASNTSLKTSSLASSVIYL